MRAAPDRLYAREHAQFARDEPAKSLPGGRVLGTEDLDRHGPCPCAVPRAKYEAECSVPDRRLDHVPVG
ncbi:hypothetical protein [Polyangium sp. 15x6]|uniref:hypothetical protein n=1 Tax=Polyangium sp. 15x6 TaxID=3042687 RepID=UPI00249AE95F|nr:hypothetical protein [Polyangium sp. 15x6]MDI3287350.1 hypothetical protein [Polyangium sp. 15x6]